MDEKKVQEVLDQIAEIAALIASAVGPLIGAMKAAGATLSVLGKTEEEIREVTASVLEGIESKLEDLRQTPWGRHPQDV